MKRYWPHIVKSTEKTVEDYLAKQVKDASRPDDGRMPSEIVEGKLTIYLLTDAVCISVKKANITRMKSCLKPLKGD